MSMFRTLLSAGFLATAIASAQAQTPPAAPRSEDHTTHHPADAAVPTSPMPAATAPNAMMVGGMMGGGMMPMMGMSHIEGRIAFLKAELAITDAQLPQWNAFATVLRANAKAMAGMHAEMAKRVATSAPDRADRMIAHMSARLDAMKTVSGALRTLYGALSADQQKVADELLAPGMARM